MPPSSVPVCQSLPAHALRRAALALFLGLPLAAAEATTFTWDNTTGLWSEAARWGGTAPTGANAADVLVFGGDVGTCNFAATEDLAATPFRLHALVLNATNTLASGLAQTLDFDGSAAGLSFAASGGVGPSVT
jgi:hypothetical protein